MRNHFWDIPKGIHEESTLANWQLSWASCSSQLQIAQSELLIKMRRNVTKLHGKEHLVKFDSLVLIRKRGILCELAVGWYGITYFVFVFCIFFFIFLPA